MPEIDLSIINPSKQITEAGPVPQMASLLPQEEENPEMEPLLISFARYNEKECDIDAMDNKRARKALQAIRDIGVSICTLGDFQKKLPKLEVKPVMCDGEYRKLFRGLDDVLDVDVQQIKTDSDKGRLFFFMVRNIFYVLAVKERHYETDKQR